MATGNILVADDDTAIRTVSQPGAVAAPATTCARPARASTLCSWVQAGDGDLVITDVVMPDDNAFDLLPRMQKLRPELPIIVMSRAEHAS